MPSRGVVEKKELRRSLFFFSISRSNCGGHLLCWRWYTLNKLIHFPFSRNYETPNICGQAWSVAFCGLGFVDFFLSFHYLKYMHFGWWLKCTLRPLRPGYRGQKWWLRSCNSSVSVCSISYMWNFPNIILSHPSCKPFCVLLSNIVRCTLQLSFTLIEAVFCQVFGMFLFFIVATA